VTDLPELDSQSLYAFQRRWLDDVLDEGDSLLTPGRGIWTLEHLDELLQHFVESPNTAPGLRFLEKLHIQLEPVSQAGKQLMAELLIEHFLLISPTAISRASKVQTLEAVLSWLSEPPSIDPSIVELMGMGMVHPGQWAISRRDVQLTWLINFSRAWLGQPVERRASVRADPWALRAFTDAITDTGTENARLALLHLAFPGTFAPIVSPDHKKEIVARFADLDGSETDIDRRISELQADLGHGGRVDWYLEPTRFRWQRHKSWPTLLSWIRRVHETAEWQAEERPDKVELGHRLAEVRQRFLGGDGGWPAGLRAVLTDAKVNNITRWQDHVPFLDWLDQHDADAEPAFDALWRSEGPPEALLDRFLELLPPEALAVTAGVRLNVGSLLLAARGIEALPPLKVTPLRRAFQLAGWTGEREKSKPGSVRELYKWALVLFDEVLHDLPAGPTDRLDVQSALWGIAMRDTRPASWSEQLWDEFRAFQGRPPETEIAAELPSPSADDRVDVVDHLAAAADDLLVGREFLDEIVALLDDKRQVILYGPPGTGKTYLAKRVAQALAEERGDRTRLVQFHPAMSYEDFIEGLRPQVVPESGQVTYTLSPGSFMLAAEAARAEPDARHVLVIDEINRGNLPKILGELLFLLEYRNEAAHLMYRPEKPFTLPANLHIIGTMNTADRSVALIDAALRRRFHFVPFFPHEGPMKGLLHRWLSKKGGREDVARLLDAVNTDLRSAIGDHLQIGPSHFMKDDLSDVSLQRIWTYNVFPLIEEQLWGQPAEVGSWRWDAVRVRYDFGAPSLGAAPGEEPASGVAPS
jgi:5-methylcytosine-specific restriction protein B